MNYKSRKIKLYPNNKQKSFFLKCCGINKFAYNFTIDKIKELYSNNIKWNDTIIRKELTKLKKSGELKFLYDVSCDIPKQAVKDACDAYKRFFNKNAKYPRYKNRRSKLSFFIDSYKIKFKELLLQIPTLSKKVKMSEKIIVSSGKEMKNIRVSFDGIDWWLSYSYEVESINTRERSDISLGIDVGVKTYATLSDRSVYRLDKSKLYLLERRRKRIQRKLSKYYLKVKTILSKGGKSLKSNNIAKKTLKLKNTYRKASNIINEFIHKTCNDIINKDVSRIVVEDLNIKGMIKNHKLSKAIIINSFNKFFYTLLYKCVLNSIEFIKASKFFASTQTCSNCGNVLTKENKLTLKDRVYDCKLCGFKEDRDINAAINLSRY